MGKRILITVLLLLTLHVFTTVGQNGSFTLVNDSNVAIDYEAIRDAALPLINNYEARVMIYAVVSGDSADFTRRLQADGLASSSGTNPNTFAIYIATEEQYSEVRWGAGFDGVDGDAVRRNHLNPMLRERNFTQAFVDALNGAHGQLSNPLYGLTQALRKLAVPEFWIAISIFALLFILRKMGILKGSGTSSGSSWSSSTYDSGSSWSSSSDSSSDSGGSSGGSWDD